MTAMFRGSAQSSINFDELVVDNFAGGGGASTGIEAAIGRPVDIAINHDPDAIRMHEVNHPHTRHFCESVWDIDPLEVTQGRPVGLSWFSPDCKHFSKARGSVPVSKNIRGLAWVALKWAGTVKPRVIILENVEEFQTWGALIAKRCKEAGRVIKLDGSVAAKGEYVPVEEQCLVPDPKRAGKTWRHFVAALQGFGYRVEWRMLSACDYSAPTSRKRFFMVARCDGQPIVWPEPTHGVGRIPYRTAADIIDWSLPCPSIFERKKPLAEATLRRIAKGIQRYVVECKNPFVIAQNDDSSIIPTLIQTGYGEREGQSPRVPGLNKPLGTVVASGKHALVSAFLAKHYTGVVGADVRQPTPTITTIDHNAVVTSNLVKMRGTNVGSATTSPVPTISAGGTHHAEVRAFLVKYYGNEKGGISVKEPLDTIPTRDCFGLVMVHGQAYQIVDIGMRMLTPAELFRAQGFPSDYVIEHDGRGKLFTKTAQVARCGNSVCPPLAEALVRANMMQINRQEAA